MIASSYAEAQGAIEKARQEGKTIVSTNGCFDILHKGHVTYLSEARSHGDFLFVAINADASVRAIKGPHRPINNENDRAFVLAALRSVDLVCIFQEETPETILEKLKPDFHFKGADWKGKGIPEEKLLQSWGGKVIYADYLEGYSTTQIINKTQKS